MKKIMRLIKFFRHDIWRTRISDLPKRDQMIIRQSRIIMRTIMGFKDNKCVLRASSLTFFTLLSIVPVLAMAFGVAKSFNLQAILEHQLRNAFDKMKGTEDVVQKIIDFSQNQLQNTQGGIIAGIGVLFLFWTIVKLLSNIEWAFNDIWGIQNNRSLSRKIADYLIIVVIFPIFLAISGSATAFISSQPEIWMQKYHLLSYFGPFFILMIKFLPLFILCPLFTFLYVFLPNTKVRIKAGFIAGFFTALAFMFLQMIYIYIQVKLFSKYSAIYGAFAALPLFLLYLEISWIIVLFGAEISFAAQNIDTCEFEEESLNAAPRFKQSIAIYMTTFIVERFEKKQPPPTREEIHDKLGIPAILANILLHNLTEAGIIVKVINPENDRDESYYPAIPERELTMRYILDSLDDLGHQELPYKETERYKRICSALEEMDNILEKSKANLNLTNLVYDTPEGVKNKDKA